jgi:hypothetical protein
VGHAKGNRETPESQIKRKVIQNKSKIIVEKPLFSLDWWRLGEDPILVP